MTKSDTEGSSAHGNIKGIPDTKDSVAIALSHDIDTDKPPVVVASGKGLIAEQILQIAFSCGVKVREDADLVQLLASVDIDSEIPTEAFSTVAEILSYLYRYNNEVHEPSAGSPDSQTNVEDDNHHPLQASDFLSLWTKGSSQ